MGDGVLLERLTPELAALFAERMTDGRLAPLVAVDLRLTGGAMARPVPDHGVLATLDGEICLFATGIVPTPEVGALVAQRLEELLEAVEPWATPRPFLPLRDRPGDPAEAFDPETWQRLRIARAGYDPDGVILSNRPVPLPD
jgi:hypothetical protein